MRSKAHRIKKGRIRTLAQRDGYACFYCGRDFIPIDNLEWRFRDGDAYPTLDHVIPRSQGGANHLENLVLACKKCNGEKQDQTDFLTDEQIDRLRFVSTYLRKRLPRTNMPYWTTDLDGNATRHI